MSKALRLCPHAVVLPVRMKRYREVSRHIFDIFRRFTPLVEPLSIDEAFLDVTGSTTLFGKPEAIAATIKRLVVEETGLTVSAGVAPSKFVAKIASDYQKPDGLTVVKPDEVLTFLDPLPVQKMWGVGKVTFKELSLLGIRTFGDLKKIPLDLLERKFGKHGIHMHNLALGIDNREVIPEGDIKSIGHEETFEQDIMDLALAWKELLSLSERVAGRLRRHALAGRTITLKVKYADFSRITRSETIPGSTNDGSMIYRTIRRLLKKTEIGKRPVRLLGVSVSELNQSYGRTQLDLFNETEKGKKRRCLNIALDLLHDRFGEKSVIPGTLLKIKQE
jgi:DNA polymerase-4